MPISRQFSVRLKLNILALARRLLRLILNYITPRMMGTFYHLKHFICEQRMCLFHVY